MREKVKPCPFCGGEAEYSHSHGAAHIWCSNEGCEHIGFVDSDSPYVDEVIKKWNRRDATMSIKHNRCENMAPDNGLTIYLSEENVRNLLRTMPNVIPDSNDDAYDELREIFVEHIRELDYVDEESDDEFLRKCYE